MYFMPRIDYLAAMNTRTIATNEVYWGDADDEVALERYRTLVETIDDGVCYLDPDGTVVAVNEALIEMTGYHRDELVGEHISLVLAAADVDRIEREILRRIETRDDTIISVELPAHTVDGQVVPLELRVNPVTDDGEFLGTIAVARVRSESTREQRLRSHIDGTSNAFYAVDDDFRFTYVNDRAEEYFGRTTGELLGERVWDVCPADEVDVIRDAFRTAMRSQEPTRYDRYDDVLDSQIEAHLSPSTTGVSVILHEGIESGVRKRELERFERMVETIDDGVYVTDHDGRFVFVNDAFVALCKYSREELLGAHGSLFFGDRFVDTDEEEWRKLVDGEDDSVEFETEVTGPSGETRTVQNRFVTLEIGAERGRVGVTRDVTERKAYERELERYEMVVETVGDGVYLLDENHEFTMVNSAFASMTGYDRDDLIGLHAESIFGVKYVETANAK